MRQITIPLTVQWASFLFILGILSFPTNSHAQWQEIGPLASPIVAIGDDGAGNILAASHYGTYHSTDGGDSWALVIQNEPEELYSTADWRYDPNPVAAHNGTIYATQGDWSNSYLTKSTDGGASWSYPDVKDATGEYFDPWVEDILALPGRILLANNDYGSGYPYGVRILRSDDGGTTWQATNEFSQEITHLLAGDTRLFAAFRDGSIMASLDNGVNWIPHSGGSLPGEAAEIIHLGNDKLIAVVPGHGVFRNSGNSVWSTVSNGLPSTDVQGITKNGSRLYLVTESNGVYFSKNNGNSWAYAGLNNQPLTSIAEVYIPGMGNRVIAGGQNGIFRKAPGANKWSQRKKGLSNATIQYLVAHNNKVLAGSAVTDDIQGEDDYEGFLYRANDPYKIWEQVHYGETVGRIEQQGDTAFVILNDVYDGGSLFFSEILGGGSPGYNVPWIPWESGADEMRTVAAIGNHLFYVSKWYYNNQGYEVSSDKGATFSHSNTLNVRINKFVADGSVLYALTGVGLYSSMDLGATWNLIGFAGQGVRSITTGQRHLFALIQSGSDDIVYRFDKQNPSLGWQMGATVPGLRTMVHAKKTLYATSFYDGVMYSQDKGDTWFPLSPGSGMGDVHQLAIATEGNDYLLIGTQKRGIWRHPLLSPPAARQATATPEESVKFYAYPNPTVNRIVIESEEQGVLRLVSLSGEVLKSMDLEDPQVIVDVSAYPAGVYHLQLITAKGKFTQTFVKQ